MNELIVLEIISIISFLFSILTNIFNFTNLNNYFLLFIWSVSISSIYGINASKRGYRLILIFLLSPIIIFKGASSIYFMLILTFFLYLYLTRKLNRGYYNNYIDSFRNSFFIIIGLLIFSFLGDLTNHFITFSIPFLIIYSLSTIILIRNLRHYYIGMNKETVRKLNRRYLIFISITSILITIEELRNAFFTILDFIYSLILEIVFIILYYPLSFIILKIEKFAYWILSILGTSGDMDGEFTATSVEEMENIKVLTKEFPLINLSFKIILLFLIMYIIYRLFNKHLGNKTYSFDYIEEREFISKDEVKSRRKISFKKPNSYNEQIRYYYKKYLNLLKSKNIKIEEYYTSYDINELGKEQFSINIINKIRDIYIKVRYGEGEGDSLTVEKISKLYRNLNKK